MKTLNTPLDHFKTIAEGLDTIFSMPRNSEDERKDVLASINGTIEELDRRYLAFSADMNVLLVHRAVILGRVCQFVKDSLLHGKWMDWALDHFTESDRTLEKFMTISKSAFSERYAHLGTEKVYQLCRIELLASRIDGGFEALVQDVGAETNFEAYSSKGFEKTVTKILNKKQLADLGIEVSNASLHSLTANFNLLRNQDHILTLLAEAKSEEADLDKTVENIVANKGQALPVRSRSRSSQEEDVNAIVEKFIQSFSRAIRDGEAASSIKKERIVFIGRLIGEYLESSTS